MTFRNLEKRVERLEDESDDETEEYTPIELTEEDYEFLDKMFGEGEWPPEGAETEKEALDEVFGVKPWESR